MTLFDDCLLITLPCSTIVFTLLKIPRQAKLSFVKIFLANVNQKTPYEEKCYSTPKSECKELENNKRPENLLKGASCRFL